MHVQLSVVVTGCVPISVGGGVGIHGLRNCSMVLDQLTLSPSFCDCSLTTSKAYLSVSKRSAKMIKSSTYSRYVMIYPESL